MRIDISGLAKSTNKIDLQMELNILNEKYNLSVTLDSWDVFLKELSPITDAQTKMFV